MSAAAIWRLGCCKRWFVFGRYRGNSRSSSGFSLLMHCPPCLGAERRVAAEFMGYTFDDRLKRDDARARYLDQDEVKRFIATHGDIPDGEKRHDWLKVRDEEKRPRAVKARTRTR